MIRLDELARAHREDTEILRARCHGGAAFLDGQQPDWHETIDLDMFDATSVHFDAFAQTFREGIFTAIMDNTQPGIDEVWAWRHGFLFDDHEADALNECWLTEINDRLQGTSAFGRLCEATA